MRDSQLKTPVVLLIFNRPDLAKRAFALVRSARPQKLLLVADGPRAGFPKDLELCAAARNVVEHVDWDCEVLTEYSETNLGCALRVASGLDWAFQQVDEAIILEDDCLPHPSFFPFCQELLERYRDDERIAVVSGNNFQSGEPRTPFSYYFSRHNHCWGWASWRRAWKHFDFEMRLWPELRDGGWLEDWLISPRSVRYWRYIFQLTSQGDIESWAYRWTFACWSQSMLSVLPQSNLVSNIGFGGEATHTKEGSSLAYIPTIGIGFPLVHPDFLLRDAAADAIDDRNLFRLSLKDWLRIIMRGI